MKHTKKVAFVWGSEIPAFSIGYDKPMGPQDSGFTVLFDDAPDPEDVDGRVDLASSMRGRIGSALPIEGGTKMRRLLVLVIVAATALIAFASPTLAQTTIDFDALFHEEFEGASPFQPCPTGGADPCAVGHIRGFGKATVSYEFDSEVGPVDSCIQVIFDATMTLLDGSGTLVIEETDTFCTPGNSTNTPGNQLHSFGNPFSAEGTWVVVSGTGVFADATGSGTNTSMSGGDVIIDKYAGTIELP